MMLAMDMQSSLQYLKGVGPKRAKTLAKLGLRQVSDLLNYYPRTHQDRRSFCPISKLKVSEYAVVQGTVIDISERAVRRGLSLIKVRLQDQSGFLDMVFFNQKFLKTAFAVGQNCVCFGKVEFFQGFQMNSPEFELLTEEDSQALVHTGRIVPVYALTSGISQKILRNLLMQVLEQSKPDIAENLPSSLREQYQLIDRASAIKQMHFPENMELLEAARKRLIFEEFFLVQLGLLSRKLQRKSRTKAFDYSRRADLLTKFEQSLPFELTGAQQHVISEIHTDMRSSEPMSRLVQGDVGSGKTMVAAMSALLAIENSYQVALMAPTEILAEQHFNTLDALLSPLGIECCLLLGGSTTKAKRSILDRIENGHFQVVIGTHSLIQKDVVFDKLALAIIDEQHKFGVAQRSGLAQKGQEPDVLIMTATPIPRTLSMTVYGDLDVSVIDELPKGRKEIKTFWISEKKRQGLYDFVQNHVQEGRQAYFVYPLVEESEKLDLKAASELYDELSVKIFPQFRLGLLHGRMSAFEKEEVMQQLKTGQIQILVATTVVEVGVDVPNATIMVIEHAERFGLAQLHQLRGRVGRGAEQSYCFLMAVAKTDEARQRMQVMVRTNDGFEISEEDLKIRGPGEFLGARQHGMPELKVGSMLSDMGVMQEARDQAQLLMDGQLEISQSERQVLQEQLNCNFAEKLLLASTG